MFIPLTCKVRHSLEHHARCTAVSIDVLNVHVGVRALALQELDEGVYDVAMNDIREIMDDGRMKRGKVETSDIKARRVAERHISPWTRLWFRVWVMKNEAHGQDCRLVTEMLQELPMETVYVITHLFDKRWRRWACRAH